MLKLKNLYLTLFSLFVCLEVIASGSSSDVRDNAHNELLLNSLYSNPNSLIEEKIQHSLELAKNVNSSPAIDLVVFYQPSYAAAYSEYEIHRRIPIFVETFNEAMSAHGLTNYKVVIKDIVPVVSVPDSAPYDDVVDESGNAIVDGADYLFTLAALNEMSLVNGAWVENPEYKIYQEKWAADLVLYMRESRENDPRFAGFASLGGESSSARDLGISPYSYTTVAHEIGHNLGMDHEAGNASDLVTPDYARAWECGGNRTIMYSATSFTSTARHFSDPNIVAGSEPCGDEDVAYNAKELARNYLSTSRRRPGVQSLGDAFLSQLEYQGNETDGVEIMLSRTGDTSESASVKVFAESGTAVWGEDFTQVYVTANFEPGESSTSVVFPIIDDGATEGNESFSIFLKYPYRLDLSENSHESIIIFDGDKNGAGGMVSISGPTEINEGEEANIVITRNGGVGEIVVNVTAASDVAQAGVDYNRLNSQLVFSEGEVEKTIVFEAFEDSTIENAKIVTLSIESPNSSVTFSPAAIDIAILENGETAPDRFSLSSSLSSVSEGVGIFDVTVRRTGGSSSVELSLSVNVKGQVQTLPVIFSPSETQKTIPITVDDNDIDEENYTITVTLSRGSSQAVIENSQIVVSVTDDDVSTVNEQPEQNTGSSGGGSLSFMFILFCIMFSISRTVDRKATSFKLKS